MQNTVVSIVGVFSQYGYIPGESGTILELLGTATLHTYQFQNFHHREHHRDIEENLSPEYQYKKVGVIVMGISADSPAR